MSKPDSNSITGEISTAFPSYGVKKSGKIGGIHEGDVAGGIFKTDKDTFLIKRDTKKPANDIAEFLSAKIFQTTALGTGAEIELVKNQEQQNGEPFLASKYFKNFQDFFAAEGFKTRPTKQETLESLLPPSARYVTSALSKKDDQGNYKYDNYQQALVTSLLIGDFSVHSGNMGIIDEKKIVRVDFGAAFREMSDEIAPFKSIKNRLGLEKNYFLRDHPRERIVNYEFSAELRRVANLELGSAINDTWSQLASSAPNGFKTESIKQFGQQIGVPISKLDDEEQIKAHFADKIAIRQKSLLKFANEIDIEIALKKEPQNLWAAIAKAEKEVPRYLASILNDPSKSQLKTKYSTKEIRILRENLATVNIDQTNQHTKLAQDSIIFGDQSTSISISAAKPIVGNENHHNEPYPITKAIREQIITKQFQILHEAAKQIEPSMHDMGLAAFKARLNQDGQYAAQLFNNPITKNAVQNELQKAAIEGYRDIHNKFKDELKPIDWEAQNQSNNVRSKTVEVNNTKLCTLKETTINAKGNPPGISQYRTINFPIKLNEGADGPMHLSIAVKDKNGQNIAEDKAVYFTAHYDKQGKLTEVSTPQPVKFMGKGDDAVGYIEHQGEIYTLPTTQGKYKEMMQEVAKNNGLAADLSLKIDKSKTKQPTLAKDLFFKQEERRASISNDNKIDPPKTPPLKRRNSTGNIGRN